MSAPVLVAVAEIAPSELGSAWEPVPAVLAGAALAAALFAQGVVRLRRRGRPDLAGGGRVVLFALGLTLLVLALVSPLDAIGEQYLLSGHMLQHVVIGDAAPALLVLAVRGPLVFFLLPAAALAALAAVRPLRALLRVLARPRVAFGLWALVLAIWHVPALYDAALDNAVLHDLEHASFVLAGFLVWNQLLDPARRGALTRGGRLGFAVALLAAGQVLSMVLLFSFDPLYPTYAAQEERLLGLSPLLDQRLAGAVMMAEQLVALGTFSAFLLLGAEREQRDDAAAHLTVEPRP